MKPAFPNKKGLNNIRKEWGRKKKGRAR